MLRCAFVLCVISASLASPNQNVGFDNRIINGSPAAKGQFPWQVALYMNKEGRSYFCGGAMISNFWILTADHCVNKASKVVVLLGTLYSDGSEATRIEAIKWISYPNDLLTSSDIALVQLSELTSLTSYIQPIKLSTKSLGGGVTVTVSGWGRTSDTSSVSQQLNYVSLKTISCFECLLHYSFSIIGKANIICAKGQTTESTCFGDSGGPLITGSGKEATLVGVVSFVSAAGCSKGFPSGYTQVAPYRKWIKSVTGLSV